MRRSELLIGILLLVLLFVGIWFGLDATVKRHAERAGAWRPGRVWIDSTRQIICYAETYAMSCVRTD